MELLHGDCLELLPTLEDGSVDMVLCDPPYGTTACKWDSVIPLELMWEQLKRITKPNAAIVMTASQPFTTILIASNMVMFKQCLVWHKSRPSDFMNAKRRIMKQHEDVLVFYQKPPVYNPQMWESTPMNTVLKSGGQKDGGTFNSSKSMPDIKAAKVNRTTRYPISIIRINEIIGNSAEKKVGKHPTQKPVALMEYFIKTYSQLGDTILDFTMGSGTTGVAAKNLSRDFIGIELDDQYFQIAYDRIMEP